MSKKRKPTLPGIILEEHYIKPLSIGKSVFAKALGISRNTLYKILDGRARITADIAVRLSKVLKTTPELWLNLQQKFDIWEAENDSSLKSENIKPLIAIAHSR
jgi:addiction module HigA family antidote